MPLHDYITQIYRESADSSYIIRFINYLISTTNRRTTFTVNGYSAEPLISGILQNTKTKERYYSLAQFYNKVTQGNISETDTSIFKGINVTSEYTLLRLLSTIQEKTIIEFFDQKYRSFLMYRDVRKRIEYYTSISINGDVTLQWNDNEFILSRTTLKCKDSPYTVYKLLEAYEDGFIKDLYYCNKDNRYLITDS